MTTALRGTLTALVTPFRNGRLDLAALEKLVIRQLEAGVDGLVPCGTTGESPTLTEEEHRQVVTMVVKLAGGRVPVVAGSGTNCTTKTVALAQLNAECGADALLVVAPYYNKPSQEGLFRHFSAVAQATALPIMVYNIPGRCGVEIAVETIKRLRAAHPNISAVKHATGSVAGAADLLAVSDVPVLSGDDPLTLPLMSLGAVGVVSVISNLAPRMTKRLTQAALDGDWNAALAAHRVLYPLAKALLGLDTNPIPIKTALAIKGWCTDELRLPLCELPTEKRRTLETLLNDNAVE
jgi:4-hydroxy-tetrahydrodipicolinate synthase